MDPNRSNTPQRSPTGGSPTRASLIVEWQAARRRREAAPLGSEAYRIAADDIARIEVEIARLERAMDPPRV
jgi:hypothetical protein